MGLIDRWRNRGSFTCKTCGQPKTRHQHANDGVCERCYHIDWERRYNAAKEELAAKEQAEKDKEHHKLVSALKAALLELRNDRVFDLVPRNWEEAQILPTGDRDDPEHTELRFLMGGNGDLYITTAPKGRKPTRWVHIILSGGHNTQMPEVTRHLCGAFRALYEYHQGKST